MKKDARKAFAYSLAHSLMVAAFSTGTCICGGSAELVDEDEIAFYHMIEHQEDCPVFLSGFHLNRLCVHKMGVKRGEEPPEADEQSDE